MIEIFYDQQTSKYVIVSNNGTRFMEVDGNEPITSSNFLEIADRLGYDQIGYIITLNGKYIQIQWIINNSQKELFCQKMIIIQIYYNGLDIKIVTRPIEYNCI